MDAINQSLKDVANAMQQVQHQQLAINLLLADPLITLRQQLEDTAKRTNTELLTASAGRPLFYSTDKTPLSCTMFLPMVPPNILSTLFKLRPFTDGDSLIPKKSSELLAISNSLSTHWSIIYKYNLLSCSRINNIFVCRGQAILRSGAYKGIV